MPAEVSEVSSGGDQRQLAVASKFSIVGGSNVSMGLIVGTLGGK